MENVILISLSTEADLTDLEPAKNLLIHVDETNNFYRGNGEEQPIQLLDEKKPILYSRIYLYE